MSFCPKYQQPDDEGIKNILGQMKRIAVVGISPKVDRASHGVAKFLIGKGFEVVGVNPILDESVLGMEIYPSLKEVPGPVDLVNIFRRSDQVGPIVDAAIARGDKGVWLQEQVINPDAAAAASQAGMNVVMDVCLYKEWLRLMTG